MKHPTLIAAVALVAAPFCSADPKAYELVNYSGKGTGVTVSYAFADGYPEASKITITTNGKSTKFRYGEDKDNKMRFVPTAENAGKAVVTLKMGAYDAAPDKVEGTYTTGGKESAFTLTKVRK